MNRSITRAIVLSLVIAGCGNKKTPSETKEPAAKLATAATPATIERLCKALEVCGKAPGLCDHPIGLNISHEDAGWLIKVAMGNEGETNKQALVDLEKGTCDGATATIPEVAGGVTVESVIAKARACASGPPWNGKTKNGPIGFQHAMVSRFAMDGGRPPLYSVDASDGSETVSINVDPATGKCSSDPRVNPSE